MNKKYYKNINICVWCALGALCFFAQYVSGKGYISEQVAKAIILFLFSVGLFISCIFGNFAKETMPGYGCYKKADNPSSYKYVQIMGYILFLFTFCLFLYALASVF
jgi:hypothetical protein